MNDSNIHDIPNRYPDIQDKSKAIGFTMASDHYAGSLLKTLISAKPQGDFLELGTGIGLSLSWMVDGMDPSAGLISIDNDPELIKIAKTYFGNDKRVQLICADAGEWIANNKTLRFDLIFADAWPGKYSHIDEILDTVKIGGLYVIDDMSQQPNWPAGHQEKVDELITYLENRKDFSVTKMNWSTGILIATRMY